MQLATVRNDPHWSEDAELASATRTIFDSIAPKEWNVHTWDAHGAGAGRLDTADAHRIIAMVINELDPEVLGK